MINPTNTRSNAEVAEPKFTAAQIQENCPARLQRIGEEITRRFQQTQEHAKTLDAQVIELNNLIAEARELCDGGGFDAFQRLFFPQLGKSRVYELFAIDTKKKTPEEIRASTRARVAKHRAKKVTASVSVTVTEKPELELAHKEVGGAASTSSKQTPEAAVAPVSVTVTENADPEGAPTEGGAAEATCTTSTPKKRKSLHWHLDVTHFSTAVRRLSELIGDKKPRRFADSSATADQLEGLGKFFIDIAKIKKTSDAVKPAPALALHGRTGSAEQFAEDVGTERDLDARVAALLPK